MPEAIDSRQFIGERVRVHFNLFQCKRGKPVPGESCWAVRVPPAKTVAGYVTSLLLKDVKFIVSEAGVDRIRRLGKRKVVAWFEGTVVDPNSPRMKRAIGSDDWFGVGFDPFVGYSFYLPEADEEVDDAPLVYVSGRKAIALFNMPNPGHEAEHAEGELEALIEAFGADVSY